jgi:omega-6 fatty acid desaturase (delta-12 desaturase)
MGMRKWLGDKIYPAVHAVTNLVFGWPVYLMTGASGGPKYGTSNHFIPTKPFDTTLWPANKPSKVWQSDIGIVAVLGGLAALAWKFGVAHIAALYLLPLIVTNMWLVGYTWLQHTDVDVPHLSAKEHSYMRGAFLTIDRPYGKLIDYLHHNIGSTHVAHHIDCTIPHYYAAEATEAIKKKWPDLYLHDPTPIHEALWRVAANCSAVKFNAEDGRYTWVPPNEAEAPVPATTR